MKIALLLPITLSELQPLFPRQKLTGGYSYPLFVPLVYHYLSLGHEIVVCTEDNSSRIPRVYYGEKITLFCAGTLPRAKLRAAMSFQYEIYQMVSFLRKNTCDIYHAHWLYDFAQAAMRVNKEKVLITIHDWPDNINRTYHDFYWNRRLEMGRRNLRAGCFFTTVSPYMMKHMENDYPEKQVELIPNFINTKCISNTEKQLRKTNQVLVAISNGFSGHKNIKNLILAFEIVRRTFSNCTLKLIGKGQGIGEEGYCWTRLYSSTDGIEFIGQIDHNQAMDELDKADIFVHPSQEESFCMVILEAMSHSIPVIGGKNSGAVPWLLENGKSGKLVDIESPEAIADAIVELLRDPDQWQTMACAGRERAKLFSIESIGEMYLNTYRRIISKCV